VSDKVKGEEADYCEWLSDVIERYSKVLFLERHDIRVERKDGDNYLSFSFAHPYLDNKLYYSADAMQTWAKDRRRATRQIIHELCHAVTDPLYSAGTERYQTPREIERARENVTDHVARIVDELTNQGPPL
jgi:hypothetical protein